MKAMRILLAIVILGFSSCSSQNAKVTGDGYGVDYSVYVKQGEELVYCKSSTNIPAELLYYTSKQVKINVNVPELAEPFTSYHITDVKNKVFSVNSDEFKTYVCFTVEKI